MNRCDMFQVAAGVALILLGLAVVYYVLVGEAGRALMFAVLSLLLIQSTRDFCACSRKE